MEIKTQHGQCSMAFAMRMGNCCIEKTRGPYQHRFDHQIGSQELSEGLTETLKGEVLEETGYAAALIQI